ncbi:hypothetical protein ACIQVK_19160 [Streptomyces sp. NPDC090493]|uniref:hypothetical protein n=1 Tax=Streptomyces sp. NPDC090493 TaxID=3365964 RepID=UPI003817C25B
MNLDPSDSIDLGVTPAPASEPAISPRPPLAVGDVVTLADVIGANSVMITTASRLDPAFFADRENVLAMVADWSRDQLYALGNVLVGEGDRRIEGELLEVLRAMCAGEPGNPLATHVEFVTNPNSGDGVYLDDETVYVHIEGHDEPIPVDFENSDDEEEQVATHGRSRDLLAGYSRHDPPGDGDHLVVNLATGDFDRSERPTVV